MNSNLIDKWRIIISGDAYSAPEIRRFKLQGQYFSFFPSDKHGLWMTSSPIIGWENDGWTLVTRSGSKYDLGILGMEKDYIDDSWNKNEHIYGKLLSDIVKDWPGIPLK